MLMALFIFAAPYEVIAAISAYYAMPRHDIIFHAAMLHDAAPRCQRTPDAAFRQRQRCRAICCYCATMLPAIMILLRHSARCRCYAHIIAGCCSMLLRCARHAARLIWRVPRAACGAICRRYHAPLLKAPLFRFFSLMMLRRSPNTNGTEVYR